MYAPQNARQFIVSTIVDLYILIAAVIFVRFFLLLFFFWFKMLPFQIDFNLFDLSFVSFSIAVRKTQDKLHSAEEKLRETESNQADRVDKSLLKNLLIGYIMAPNNDKQQILKLISSVLDFNQQESDKVGLNRTHTGWLTSILHGSAAPNNNPGGKFNYLVFFFNGMEWNAINADK